MAAILSQPPCDNLWWICFISPMCDSNSSPASISMAAFHWVLWSLCQQADSTMAAHWQLSGAPNQAVLSHINCQTGSTHTAASRLPPIEVGRASARQSLDNLIYKIELMFREKKVACWFGGHQIGLQSFKCLIVLGKDSNIFAFYHFCAVRWLAI